MIDGAPRVNELARSAILASNHVLMPVQPSPFDVWSCAEIVGLVQEAQQFRPDITASFVINRKIPNTAIARDVLAAFAGFPFPMSDIAVTQRVGFAEAAVQGLTVIETAPSSVSSMQIYDLAESLISVTKESRVA